MDTTEDITFGDFTDKEIKQIRCLSDTIKVQLAQHGSEQRLFQTRSSPDFIEIFKFCVDQDDLDTLGEEIMFDGKINNDNNNADKNPSGEQPESIRGPSPQPQRSSPRIQDLMPNTQDRLEAGGSNAPGFSMHPQHELLRNRPNLRIFNDGQSRRFETSTSPNEELSDPLNISTDFRIPPTVTESTRLPLNQTRASTPVQPTNLDFDVSNLIDKYNQETRSIDLQTRLDVRVFPPALTLWRQLRNLQSRKIILELHISFNEKLLQSEHYPDWSVNFMPPVSLINSERAIDLVIQHRTASSKDAIQTLIELMKEESQRLNHEINITQNSVRLHYDHPDTASFDIREALHALNVFSRRTKENELSELTRKYNAIHLAPTAALWKELPEGTRLPPSAMQQTRIEPQRSPNALINQSNQNFRGTGRGTRCPSRGQGQRGFMS